VNKRVHCKKAIIANVAKLIPLDSFSIKEYIVDVEYIQFMHIREQQCISLCKEDVLKQQQQQPLFKLGMTVHIRPHSGFIYLLLTIMDLPQIGEITDQG
jgi:hypothetical protein